ncbi:MAG TPA: GNAT family N-acetyltransferase, partial [Nitrospinota bacterium]|nr:GNAT family N-acetyltransferase [Nitrospinota bacterium]
MMIVQKPEIEDLKKIHKILIQWTEKREADKYLKRISDEVNGQTKFNMQFWVAREKNQVFGVIGLADPLPKILPLATTKKPGEVKILYVNDKNQGKGIGKKLTLFLEEEAKKQGYQEMIVRSAERYKDTAWGFYDKMGYTRL